MDATAMKPPRAGVTAECCLVIAHSPCAASTARTLRTGVNRDITGEEKTPPENVMTTSASREVRCGRLKAYLSGRQRANGCPGGKGGGNAGQTLGGAAV